MANEEAPIRPLTEQECVEVLARGSLGRLACYSPSRDESYVVPTSFTYHPGAIYFASTPGQKLSFLLEHPRGVCLEVEEVRGGEHTTVLALGDFEPLQEAPELPSPAERRPLRTSFEGGLAPYAAQDLILCKLNVRKVSGRLDRWSWQTDFPVPTAATGK